MPIINIVDRFDHSRVLHQCEAETFRDAVLKLVSSRANLSGANLSGADLSGAYLSGANLSGADLSRANLSGADLSGADLSRAYLSRANLSGADLSGADLSGAYLSRAYLSRANLSRANLSRAYLSRANLSRANLSGANLSGANLSGANLSRAYLSRAYLDDIRKDLQEVLDAAPLDVVGLLEALRAGKIDGSVYDGACACLVGTLENVATARECPIDLPRDSGRPAERWFLALQPGHTPENHPVAKITEDWIAEWLTEWAKKSPELHAKAMLGANQRELARLEARVAELRASMNAEPAHA